MDRRCTEYAWHYTHPSVTPTLVSTIWRRFQRSGSSALALDVSEG
ncbi:MAG TPA: hypothetical protein V6D11_29785 [Waterburya sp.]